MFKIINLCRSVNVFLVPRLAVCLQTANSSTRTIEERLGLPPRPRKPLTPFFRYMMSARPKVQIEKPEMSAMEITKLVAKTWAGISEQQKLKYSLDYEQEKKEYKVKAAQYELRLTTDQKEDIELAKEYLLEKKTKSINKKKAVDKDKPKKPMSAFIRYCHSLSDDPDNKVAYRKTHMKDAAESWKKLSQEEKNVHIDASRRESVQYKKQLIEWEAKMVAAGDIELVRNVALNDIDIDSKKRLMRILSTKPIEEQLDLPARPKRPLTPFFRFRQLFTPVIKAEKPKITFSEISRELSKRWAEADESLKQKLALEYEVDRVNYAQKIVNHEGNISEEKLYEIQLAKRYIKKDKLKRIDRKKIRALNRPKKPASGFCRFLKERLEGKKRDGLTQRDLVKQVTTEWRELPEDKRKIYNDAGKAERATYNQELAKWEAEMVQQGHFNEVGDNSELKSHKEAAGDKDGKSS